MKSLKRHEGNRCSSVGEVEGNHIKTYSRRLNLILNLILSGKSDTVCLFVCIKPSGFDVLY